MAMRRTSVQARPGQARESGIGVWCAGHGLMPSGNEKRRRGGAGLQVGAKEGVKVGADWRAHAGLQITTRRMSQAT